NGPSFVSKAGIRYSANLAFKVKEKLFDKYEAIFEIKENYKGLRLIPAYMGLGWIPTINEEIYGDLDNNYYKPGSYEINKKGLFVRVSILRGRVVGYVEIPNGLTEVEEYLSIS
ncbi:hypothetical protein EG328_010062, partial [Venturia inaequalis]